MYLNPTPMTMAPTYSTKRNSLNNAEYAGGESSSLLSHRNSQYLSKPITYTERKHRPPHKILTVDQMMQSNVKPLQILNRGIQRMIERRKQSYQKTQKRSPSPQKQPQVNVIRQNHNQSIGGYEYQSQNES